jgi:sporulation protein YlmC with PRC-barrel domain
MTTTLLKISTLCAACLMLAVAAQAQPDSQGVINQNMPSMQPSSPSNLPPEQAGRSWSTKQLSATGRNTDQAVRASKLVGALVKDSSGNRAGEIQDIIVNPASGHIDFALVSLSDTNAAASSSGKVVPVPWALLKTASGSSEYGATPEHCTFTLKADASKLNTAPTVDWTDPSQSEWRQRIYAYYGVTPPPAAGAAESPSGEMKGQSPRQMQSVPPPQPKP